MKIELHLSFKDGPVLRNEQESVWQEEGFKQKQKNRTMFGIFEGQYVVFPSPEES